MGSWSSQNKLYFGATPGRDDDVADDDVDDVVDEDDADDDVDDRHDVHDVVHGYDDACIRSL